MNAQQVQERTVVDELLGMPMRPSGRRLLLTGASVGYLAGAALTAFGLWLAGKAGTA